MTTPRFQFSGSAERPGARSTKAATQVPNPNATEYSVSELSLAVKRTVETSFDFVRVRGEISRPTYARSGHLYFTLKDEKAVLDVVCWKGQVAKLSTRAEEGLEIIAQGRLTTYPGSSKYQLVLEAMEPAGEGALLKLLEERKKKLAGEGLFDQERKQSLPFLPRSIGVVTSPTGAVIRDILHRIADRFARPVRLWPVKVQGQGAAEQIAAAIAGFNALPDDLRPDILIVGRGGGSLEDLWAFNEEVVVRAIADSRLPIISAVGHETDTTLADFAADWRAPTPTGAAERAVPVRTELLLGVEDYGLRLGRSGQALMARRKEALAGLARGLGQPGQLLDLAYQRSDTLAQRLDRGFERQVQVKSQAVERLALKLLHPRETLRAAEDRLTQGFERLGLASRSMLRAAAGDWRNLQAPRRLAQALQRQLDRDGQALSQLVALMASYQAVDKRALERGYARVERPDGSLVTQAAALAAGERLRLVFSDGAGLVQALGQSEPLGQSDPVGKSESTGPQSQPKPALGQPHADAKEPDSPNAPAVDAAVETEPEKASAQRSGKEGRKEKPRSKDQDDKQGWLL